MNSRTMINNINLTTLEDKHEDSLDFFTTISITLEKIDLLLLKLNMYSGGELTFNFNAKEMEERKEIYKFNTKTT